MQQSTYTYKRWIGINASVEKTCLLPLACCVSFAHDFGEEFMKYTTSKRMKTFELNWMKSKLLRCKKRDRKTVLNCNKNRSSSIFNYFWLAPGPRKDISTSCFLFIHWRNERNGMNERKIQIIEWFKCKFINAPKTRCTN